LKIRFEKEAKFVSISMGHCVVGMDPLRELSEMNIIFQWIDAYI